MAQNSNNLELRRLRALFRSARKRGDRGRASVIAAKMAKLLLAVGRPTEARRMLALATVSSQGRYGKPVMVTLGPLIARKIHLQVKSQAVGSTVRSSRIQAAIGGQPGDDDVDPPIKKNTKRSLSEF